MKKIMLTLIIALCAACTFAQEVEITKDEVMLNGKAILKYRQINYIQHSFSTLTGDEILFYRFSDNNTSGYTKDDYMILNFITAKKKVEVSDLSRISAMRIKKVMEKLIKWLVEDKVITETGDINPDKLDVFYEKYNDSNIGR